MRRLIAALLLLAALAPLACVYPSLAQGLAPAFLSQGPLGASSTKFPALAAAAGAVHLAANRDRADAIYAARAAGADGFTPFERVGPAEGQPDYSTASVAVAPDGRVVYAWVNQPARTISLRVRSAQGWGATSVVVSGEPFPVHPAVAVTSDGAIVVVWRNPDRPFRARRSLDGGATWGPIQSLSTGAGVNAPDLAAGPAGQLAVAFTQGEADRLQVYVSTWVGGSFAAPGRVTALSGDYADPSVSYAPDGRLYVAWRGVAEGGGAAGVFFAERQADGSYPVARLIGGKVAGRVSIEADAARNLHVLWTAAAGGSYQVWYATKPAAGGWQGPIAAPVASGIPFNASMAVAADASGAVFAHAVSERFAGARVSLHGYRFASGLAATLAPAARPVIEQDAARTRAASVAVRFFDIAGSPTELRYRWGAPPTDADPWQPFAETLIVSAPPAPAGCVPLALFTQVRSGGGVGPVASDTITQDAGVQVAVASHDPDAAPGYTNLPALAALIADAGECSGLASARAVAEGAQPAPVPALPYLLTLGLPDQEGRHERAIELADRLGNTAILTASVVYDRTPPVAAFPRAPAISVSPRATVLQTIEIRGATYSDGTGPGDLPWAVALRVGRGSAPQADRPWVVLPLGDQVERVVSERGPVVNADLAVNLTELLPAGELSPGAYTYAIALVDRAGNRADAQATATVTLDRVSFPPLSLPLLKR